MEGGEFGAPFLGDDAVGCEPENVQSAVPDEAEVGGAGDGYARIEERRVLDAIAVEALGPELQHGASGL